MTSTKPNVYLPLGSQGENLGDLMLNRSLARYCARNWHLVLDDHYEHVNDTYVKELGLPEGSFSMLSKRQDLPNLRSPSGILKFLLSRHRAYDVFFRSPGGTWGSASWRACCKVAVYILFFAMLRFRGVKTASIGAHTNTDHLHGIRLSLERVFANLHTIYSYRNRELVEVLQRRGISNAQHIPDIFMLETHDEEPLTHSEFHGRSKKYCVLNFRRTIPEASNPKTYEDDLRKQIRSLLMFLPADYEIIFAYQVKRDKDFAKELSQSTNDIRTVNVRPQQESVESAGELYRTASLVVTNRLHCFLYAFIQGSPAIALSNWQEHNKLRSTILDFGLGKQFLDIEADSDSISKLLQAMLANEWDTRKQSYSKARGIKFQVENSLRQALEG